MEIKLTKGLDINLEGKPERKLTETAKSYYCVMVPDDFNGIIPKVVVKPGEKVKAETPLMTDKNRPEIKFVSPFSGEVTAVERGERRKVLGIVVKKDDVNQFVDFGAKKVSAMNADEIKNTLLNSGVWPFIKQRPYDIIANPDVTPRDIFVSAFDSAPLAAEFDFIAQNETEAINAGIEALSKLTTGKVYVGARPDSSIKFNNCEVVTISGPHPAGNAGIQAHNIKPVNKGETIWTLSAYDLIIIGRVFTQGKADFERIVAVTGSEVSSPCYVKTYPGTPIKTLVNNNLVNADYKRRYIWPCLNYFI